MTLHHFKALSQENQRKILLQHGVFLAERRTETFSIMLFELNGIYIELFFLNESDEIFYIKSFDCTDELEPYLTEIDLSQLVN